MSPLTQLSLVLVTLLAMLSVGVEFPAHPKSVLAQIRGSFVLGLLAQFTLVPAIAIALVWLAPLPPDLASGILLLAACPVGGIVNFYALLARASVPLAVATSLATCSLASLSMPLIARIYRHVLPQAPTWSAPSFSIVLQIAALVLVPILLGVFCRVLAPRFTAKISRPLRILTLAAIAWIILLLIIDQRAWLAVHALGASLLSFTFMLLCIGAGALISRLARFPRDDSFTLGATWSVRNVALAGTVAATILHQPALAAFSATYFLCQIPLMLLLARLHRQFAPTPAAAAKPVTHAQLAGAP